MNSKDHPSHGRVLKGLQFWTRGVFFVFHHISLWKYFIVPLLLNTFVMIILYGLGFYYMKDSLPDLSFHGPDGHWYSLSYLGLLFKESMHYIWHLALWMITIVSWSILTLILYIYSASIAGALFYDRLSLQIESLKGKPFKDQPFNFRKDLLIPIRYAIKTTLFQGMVLLVAFPLSFIPFIGSFLYLIFIVFLLSLTLTSYCYERRFWTLRQQIKDAWKWRYDYLGFGLAAFVSILPFGLNIFTFPLSIAGATLLFLEHQD
ncbi:MAG: EI24 domain-containing protein [Candidatus Aureabacteria bacterium]|nr:EI24 domain-containing protein [Candidatus Auribacterota bacterium]